MDVSFSTDSYCHCRLVPYISYLDQQGWLNPIIAKSSENSAGVKIQAQR
jgi:hypothetical protein